MARFYDRIMRGGKGQVGMNDIHVISADNVANYFYKDSLKTRFVEQNTEWISDWTKQDFPNLAPPFERFFIEFKRPKDIDEYVLPIETGVAFNAHKNNAGGWGMEALVYIAFYKNETTSPAAYFQWRVHENGELDTTWQYAVNKKHENLKVGDEDEAIAENLRGMAIYPCFLAISLMHCKNVALQSISPNAPLSKKHQKKHGKPLVRCHILDIEPMKKVLRTEGKSESFGLKKALHICRGHFKDYRDGQGLFGRHKEIYWWESHARGDVGEGLVDKDYRINFR